MADSNVLRYEYPAFQHTPTPWVFGVYTATPAFDAIVDHVSVCKPDMSLIATCGPAGDENSEADAEFICRAVNGYTASIEALELARRVLRMITNNDPYWRNKTQTREAMSAIDAALNLACASEINTEAAS